MSPFFLLVHEEWQPHEWQIVSEAAADVMRSCDWSADLLRWAVGGRQGRQVRVRRLRGYEQTTFSARSYEPDEQTLCIELYDRCFDGCGGRFADVHLYAKGTFVHELAHLWDLAHDTDISYQFLQVTDGAYEERQGGYVYRFKGSTTPYGRSSHYEDFAESFATYVYGERYVNGNGRWVDTQRLQFIEQKVREERARFSVQDVESL